MKGYEAAAGRRHLRSADTMKLLVARATAAKINRGFQIFFRMLPWPSPPPANFGPKRCFLVRYSCIPNLKLLASTVAEIHKGSQIFGCSFSPAPLQFWS